ncbi:MAG: hypothetical protein HYZ93_02910 [Candidatus Omnitrophica bacterium]|nr:hypothetical protein [Candidatus Omnitrophota bacterium]
MKTRALSIIAYSLLFLTAWSLEPTAAFGEQAALKEVPPLPQGTVLFQGEVRLGQRGRLGGYAMKPSKYGVYPDRKVRREGSSEQPIHVRYLKAAGPSFAGVYVVLVGDLSRYATMSFWVKGLKGGEAFEIGINDVISNKREDAVFAGSIYRYLPQGLTPQWQEVRIPLEDFFGADLARVYSLVLNFNEEGTGELWLEGLAFHTEPLVDREALMERQGELLLDNFDHSDLNLLGRKANAYKRLPSVCAVSRVLEPRVGAGGRSLRLDWEKQTTGWCGYYTLLNQVDGAYFDLGPYKSVRFWVRGLKGGESFEIGMADRSWLTIGDSVKAGPVERYLAGGVTAEWKEVVIPLSDFGKLDWTQMGSFVINFPQPGQGTVFVDDLRFIRKTQEDLLKEWETQ